MSLKAVELTKKYGSQTALNRVNFEIKTGEVVGFLGPNGAGKSTMMKILTGYIKQNSGDVFINDMNTKNQIERIKNHIGYLPEHNPLYRDMYIKEYLNFTAKIYGIKDNLQKYVNNIIEQTGLGIEQHKKIGDLSKGYRQRTGLAAALIHNPDVLILDEPTTGLDPNQIIEIRDLITQAGKEKTVLLSTHIMQEVEAICNRVIIINKGQIIADNSVSQIQKLSMQKHDLLSVEFNEPVEIESLKKINGILNLHTTDNKNISIETELNKDVREHIFQFAVEQKKLLLTMYKKEKSMEDVFRELTK
jgi:ABC-2 type transport system ATP-binding protein